MHGGCINKPPYEVAEGQCPNWPCDCVEDDPSFWDSLVYALDDCIESQEEEEMEVWGEAEEGGEGVEDQVDLQELADEADEEQGGDVGFSQGVGAQEVEDGD